MNTDVLQGIWHQAKGDARVKWGKLTNDDLDVIQGNSEKLAGKIQERYGYAKDRAMHEVDEFVRKHRAPEATPISE